MKKTLKLALCGLMLAGAASAQVLTLPAGWDESLEFEETWGILPARFSADNKSKILSSDISEDGEFVKINVYNDSFNIEHSIEIKGRRKNENADGWYNTYYLEAIWDVVDIDANGLTTDDAPMYVTQTLFNNDDKYEYARPKYDTSGEKIIGMEVVSEDGNIIANFDGLVDVELLIWNGKYYLIGEYGWDENTKTGRYAFYEINPNVNGITRVSSEAFMHILPAMPRKNTSVTVEFGEESVKDGGQLMIVDMSGRTVYRNAVAPGETSVRVPLRRIASGVYNVTLVNGKKKVEGSKLIVR